MATSLHLATLQPWVCNQGSRVKNGDNVQARLLQNVNEDFASQAHQKGVKGCFITQFLCCRRVHFWKSLRKVWKVTHGTSWAWFSLTIIGFSWLWLSRFKSFPWRIVRNETLFITEKGFCSRKDGLVVKVANLARYQSPLAYFVLCHA